jgi:CHAD domain-containing protein
MKTLIGERWGAVWAAMPAAIAGDDIEGVHDVRVASRRLRAAMDVAVACFPAGWYRPLHRGAKEITRSLGAVRDRDVQSAALTAERDAAAVAERPGIQRLIDRVEAERVEARGDMEAFVARLLASDLPSEVGRRFGPMAAPPSALLAGNLGGEETSA